MKLNDEVKREINRMAHALSQWSYVEHRQRLTAEAAELQLAGRPVTEILRHLRVAAVGGPPRLDTSVTVERKS